ncbi:ATP-binding protein [Actinocrispum sp. NPDC049592]|uniref:sensor histidine kinase n=1 Tax=Actinocrispum sp. NPDC049592 TaxID=3154835 RepID=UPI003441F6DA
MNEWRIGRWATILIVVEAVMLAAAVVLGVVGLQNLSDARSRVVDQIDPELLQAQRLNAAMLNQETGLRGFLLTGQQSFRQPYDDGRQTATEAIAGLRDLGAVPGTDAGRDLDTVMSKIDAWQRIAEQMLAGSTDPTLVDRSKTAFDDLRSTMDGQRRNLAAARDVDRNRLSRSATLLSVILGAIIVLLVALFVLLALGFHRKIALPIQALAGEVRKATDDINREIPAGGGPQELTELAEDVEDMRKRIVAEVDELRRAHELLDQRTRELQRSNSDLEQFAYVASHDLQEPLRKVTSFVQLIQRRYQDKLDERGEQYIEFAVDGARRMSVLINDLLAFSRVGRSTGEFVDVDTGAVLDAALSNLESVIEFSGAKITRTDLPHVRGEASLLTVVFQNLISNAIKFRGDTTPQIRVSAVEGDGEWKFSVTDNGIGIEAEYAERIFVIFQRLHPRAAYPGTGIGLAMARKIVEFHGGRIWLDTVTNNSEAGKTVPDKTTFSFTLPSEGK